VNPGHALAYPRLYVAAYKARRRVRAVGPATEALALARSLGMGPTQADEELLWLLGLLHGQPPATVVEIGTDEGGTLLVWTRAASPDALLVALDIRPLGLLGRLSAWAVLRRGFARDGQRVELLMPVDSHDPRTCERLRRRLAGRAIDFLFIDGDHTYEGVKRDFEMYSPLVRPGGLVALHDVIAGDEPEVVRYWQELKEGYATEEYAADGPTRYGIGVVRV
jgi:predicted O-methyltransferase YrrM